MSKSVTSTAIAAASKAAYAQGLKAAGFRRQGNHLHRQPMDLIHGVHFQASQWGSASEGRFTVNLVVTSETLYRGWLFRPLPTNPATALFPVQERIGSLMPAKRDHWWEVTLRTDLPQLAEEVAQAVLTYGLPFFEGFPSSDALLERFRAGGALPGLTRHQVPVIHAMLAACKGHMAEAEAQLRGALAGAAGSPFQGTVKSVAARLGVRLEGEVARG